MNFPLYICCFVCLIRASTGYLNHFRSWTWHFWRSKRWTPRGISTWRSVEQCGKKSWTHNQQSSSAEPVVIVFPDVEWPSYQNHWWFTAYCSLWYISADWSGFFHGTMTGHWADLPDSCNLSLTNSGETTKCSSSLLLRKHHSTNNKSRQMSDFTVSAF